MNRKSNQNQLEEMVNSIKEEIIMGKRKPGDFLPSEKALSKQFQISNLTVRRGLEQLVEENLIEKIPRVGNRVVDAADLGVVTVQFAYHRTLIDEAVLDVLLDHFHRAHPNIRVQTFVISSTNYFQMIKELMDRETIDVLSINYNNYRDFVDNDGLDYLESLEEKEDIYPFLTEQFYDEGQLRVQPFIFSPLILCYNKDHFRKHQLGEPDSSWRWDRLLEIADQLAIENERLGFYCHISSLNRWVVFFIQSGMSVTRDEQGMLQFPDTPLLEALNAVKEVVMRMNLHPLLVSDSAVDAEELFFEGKVSMIMTTYLRLNHDNKRPVQFDIAPLPYLYQQKTTLQTIGLGVASRSKVKESAKVLIDFLTSYEAQLLIRQHTLSIPAYKLAAEWNGEEKMYRPSRYSMYREIIPSLCKYTDLNMTERELKEFARAIRFYWSGLEQEEMLKKRLQFI